jgi:hypothetical protein
MRAAVSLATFCVLLSLSFGDVFAQANRKEFPQGAVRAFQDLPGGRLREQIERLPAQARDRAVAWLGNIHFTVEDLDTIHVDAGGGIFYIDQFEFAPAPPPREEKGEVEIAAAAVPVSPFPANLVFHSRPGAPNVLYLNFTGENVSNTAWNDEVGRTSIPAVAFSTDTNLATFSDSEQLAIRRIWQRVAEDYAPFNIDVTTERPTTFNGRTAHALITRHTDANGADNPASFAGGVAYVGVFGSITYAKYRPAWIYHDNLANEESYAAEAVSHEIAHNLGLTHDGQTDGTDYYLGHGSGDTSWGPLMGTGYNRNVSQWSKGEYYLANNTQDDLATIAGKLSYRADDHGNTFGSATALSISTGGAIVSTTPETDPANGTPANKGVLERNTDVDLFSFTTGAGTVSLSVKPWVVPGAITRGGNVDLVLELHNSSGQLLLSTNATSSTAGVIQKSLAEGVYYLTVKGTGVGNPTSSNPSGYTSYGSIGQYFISGTVVQSAIVTPPGAELAITDITEPGVAGKLFTVTYSDDLAVDVASIGNDDIRVTGPNGYNRPAALVSVDLLSNGSPRIATYRIDPLNGTWSESDNGDYTVTIQPNAVSDTEGEFVPARTLGTFAVAVSRAIYFASMNTNPGWSMQGQWQHGAPRYKSGGPVAGFTGTNILAYNLSGHYENLLSAVYATTPPINCAGASTVTLRFQRWLRVRSGDTANIQISTNGTSWTELWTNGRQVSDNSWQAVQYSLPSWVAGSSSLQIRWGMASGLLQNEIGWNIDDVAVLGDGAVDTTPPTATLNAANLTSGGSPAHTFTVSYSDDTAVKIASLGTTDLLIIGPNGTNTVEFGGVDPASDGTPRTALYSINAPSGLWSSADNGQYQVYLQDAEIMDTSNNSMEPASLGAFTVAISTNRQAIIVEPAQLKVSEGSEAAFSIRLAQKPSANVIVVARAMGEDADIIVSSGATNTFTPDNWNVPAQVTLRALADPDRDNGMATIVCQSDGLSSISVAVTEQDTTPLPPSVSLTAPGDNAEFSSTHLIGFSAAATDDGVISKVEFLANGHLIGTDTTVPYEFATALAPGNYLISAKAMDDAGASAISATVTITVSPQNEAPSVSIITPTDGAVIQSTEKIKISADATDDRGISGVEFFANEVLIGASSASPYSISPSLDPGTYSITAKATDNDGLITTSLPITIEVVEFRPPEVVAMEVEAGAVTLTLTTSSGSSHILEVSSDFQSWTAVATNTPVSGFLTFSYESAASKEFFRVLDPSP